MYQTYLNGVPPVHFCRRQESNHELLGTFKLLVTGQWNPENVKKQLSKIYLSKWESSYKRRSPPYCSCLFVEMWFSGKLLYMSRIVSMYTSSNRLHVVHSYGGHRARNSLVRSLSFSCNWPLAPMGEGVWTPINVLTQECHRSWHTSSLMNCATSRNFLSFVISVRSLAQVRWTHPQKCFKWRQWKHLQCIVLMFISN